MDHIGLTTVTRYSYPPNSLSLCGPDLQKDLAWYAACGVADMGTAEIISKFSTLYPYLCLIAGENHLQDPFDRRVVEAYWIGNTLLSAITSKTMLRHLDEHVAIGKKLPKTERQVLSEKTATGGVPHHAFHVLNIYRRTGHNDMRHTVETMDACIVNCGRVVSANNTQVIVFTRPIRTIHGRLAFDQPMQRKLRTQGHNDVVAQGLQIGDWVSYHWGYMCQKITSIQRKNLYTYTLLALNLANKRI